MLELQKHVLTQIKQHQELFMKELIKSKRWLSESDINKLKKWLQQDEFKKYHQIIEATLTQQYQIAS